MRTSGAASKPLTLSADEYAESVKSYDKYVRLLDDTLYRLCREHPGHTEPLEVHAKLWIIGRTLATGIERKVSLAQVRKLFLDHGLRLDRLMATLRTIAEPLSPDNLKNIVILHSQIVNIITAITG